MCTVTFIPAANKVFITHNRDEKSKRSKAIVPEKYVIKGYTLLFPRDSHAGGTWIALHENGNAAVLLNGGFVKHTVEPAYRKSRGLAFLEVAAAEDLLQAYQSSSLHNIEPFTLVLWNNDRLFETRWDGAQKHITELDATQSHNWSSVTLYDEEVIARRQNWFAKWQSNHTPPTLDDIIHFHLFGGEGDAHNDLRMNRDGIMLTVSVTGIEINAEGGKMKYLDLQDNTTYEQEIKFVKDPVEK